MKSRLIALCAVTASAASFLVACDRPDSRVRLTLPSGGAAPALTESRPRSEARHPSGAGPTIESSIAAGVVIEALPRPAADHQSDFATRHNSHGQASSSLAEVPSSTPGTAAMAFAAVDGAAAGPPPPPQEISASGPGP
jgi:hypothetical protein